MTLTNGQAELQRLYAQFDERDTINRTFGVKSYWPVYHFPASALPDHWDADRYDDED